MASAGMLPGKVLAMVYVHACLFEVQFPLADINMP